MDIDLSEITPPSPERTRQLAQLLPEVVRVLNHATMDHAALCHPGDADGLIRDLEIAARRLPQLLTQVVRWVEAEHTAGRVGAGEWPGSPAAAVVALQVRRDAAVAAAEQFEEALEAMTQVTSCLTAPDTGEGGDG
jgi:hypothetical protein